MTHYIPQPTLLPTPHVSKFKLHIMTFKKNIYVTDMKLMFPALFSGAIQVNWSEFKFLAGLGFLWPTVS